MSLIHAEATPLRRRGADAEPSHAALFGSMVRRIDALAVVTG